LKVQCPARFFSAVRERHSSASQFKTTDVTGILLFPNMPQSMLQRIQKLPVSKFSYLRQEALVGMGRIRVCSLNAATGRSRSAYFLLGAPQLLEQEQSLSVSPDGSSRPPAR
jgi:hypothetical protein